MSFSFFRVSSAITDKQIDTATCTADTFEPHLGELFVAQSLNNPDFSFELRMVEVTRYSERPVPEGFRKQFSILFEAADQDRPPSGELVELSNTEFGSIVLFINPVIIPTAKGSEILLEVTVT